jgi:hypothetical protein
LRICGIREGEGEIRWGKLGIEELHNIYPIPNIVRMTESRMMRCEKHAARSGDTRKT